MTDPMAFTALMLALKLQFERDGSGPLWVGLALLGYLAGCVWLIVRIVIGWLS